MNFRNKMKGHWVCSGADGGFVILKREHGQRWGGDLVVNWCKVEGLELGDERWWNWLVEKGSEAQEQDL